MGTVEKATCRYEKNMLDSAKNIDYTISFLDGLQIPP